MCSKYKPKQVANAYYYDNPQSLFAMTDKTRILFLSANPADTARLRVDKEQREIDHELKLSRSREQVEFIDAEAVRPNDLQQALLDNNPQIVHFSGHGSENGVILEDDDGNAQPISTAALANLFRLFKESVQCVVLNACYSEAQATAIGQHIPYVIGMSNAIPDEAAIRFAVGFYKAIAAGKNIEFAFEMGVNALQLDSDDATNIPILLKSPAAIALETEGKKEAAKQAVTPNPPLQKLEKSPQISLQTSPKIYLIALGATLLIFSLGMWKMCGQSKKTVLNSPDSTAQKIVVAPVLPKGQAIRTEINEVVTLEKGSYHIITPTKITYGGKLIIKPGAVISFAQDANLVVDKGGVIEAVGTATEPIIFCGESDTEGFWGGIAVLSNTKQNRMEFVQLKNAGSGFTAALQIGVFDGRFDGSVGRLSFRNSTIKDCTSSGICVYDGSTVDNFENNTITDCQKFPVIVYTNSMDLVKATAKNKLTGNKKDMIAIQGTYDTYTDRDIVLEKLSIPYCINATDRSKVVYIGANLTLKPGVRVVMTSEAAIRVDSEHGQKGSLTAIGTAAEPIVFEGEEHGQGFWDGIYLLSASDKNNLQHATFADGGKTQHCCGGGNDLASGIITIGNYYMNFRASANIQFCTFTNSSEAAIFYEKAFVRVNADLVSNNTFSNNRGGNVVVN